jgi:hypothetical protein
MKLDLSLLPFLAIFVLGIVPSALSAQSADLSRDVDFFRQQEKVYQRWLDQSGLGRVLKVHTTEVDQNKLSLYLAFRYQDLDSIQAGWESLKTAFEVTRPVSLERELFGKMLHFMQVPQEQALVQLYNTYDVTKPELFFRGIYFDAGEGTVKVSENGPKAERILKLSPANLGGMKKVSAERFKATYDKATVFRSILSYLEKRYNEDNCANREPKLTLLEEDEVLRFEVTDLCREVLTNAANPLLCELMNNLGRPCNWVRREKLDFVIAYRPLPEGFELSMQVEGSYGSGRFSEVPRGGYYSMEMEFKPYLENYADRIKTTLARVILYGKP